MSLQRQTNVFHVTKHLTKDHLTGAYRGAAHNKCNIQYGWKNYKIPVIFHNLRGYDSHFIIKCLTKKFKKITCIPSTTEKFITFTVNNLEFIDSCSFIQASLEKIIESQSQSSLLHEMQELTDINQLKPEQIKKLQKKGLADQLLEDIVKVLSQECLQQIDTKFTHFKSHFKDISNDQRLLLTEMCMII